MGYTHYFAYDPEDAQFVETWTQMVDDARRIGDAVRAQGVELAGGLGDGEPEFNEDRIWLNGPNRDGLSHETLMIESHPWWAHLPRAGEPGYDDEDPDHRWANRVREDFERRGFIWAFCKTARKPYDLAVGAVLLRCRLLAPEAFTVGSDGGWNAEWAGGADAYATHISPPSPGSIRGLVEELFEEAPDHDVLRGGTSTDGPPCVQARARG